MLQESVDALFDVEDEVGLSQNRKKTSKIFSRMLKGKQGRFRQNLLGKGLIIQEDR